VACAAGPSMKRTPMMEPNHENTTTKFEFAFSDKTLLKIQHISSHPPCLNLGLKKLQNHLEEISLIKTHHSFPISIQNIVQIYRISFDKTI
jgi:hypothetical protein